VQDSPYQAFLATPLSVSTPASPRRMAAASAEKLRAITAGSAAKPETSTKRETCCCKRLAKRAAR
jgi:hypothetical protein